MKSLRALAFVLTAVAACGGSGSHEPTVPILSAEGSISIDGRNVVPAYAVAGVGSSGKSVGVILSDAPMGCSALTADYTSRNMPEAGTYVSVGLPNFDKGVAAKSLTYFMLIGKDGSLIGTGSSDGQVEVLDATDTAVTISVDYRHTLEGIGEGVVNGSFSATRCPLPAQ
jgi:hypothetical protein